jgi:D-glycero-D-manno-heptose 1,7-bisphosphate phosphatase
MRYRTIFLDRDGTINSRPPKGQYVTSPDQLSLLPGAALAIAALNAAGLRVILVTNQRWLSGPSGSLATYNDIHARLERLLATEGASLDAAFHCPHAPFSCGCRKPLPGMLQRAARAYRLDLAEAVMIGDSETDVMAGRAAGTATILLHNGTDAANSSADAVASDLLAAVRLILRDDGRPTSPDGTDNAAS